MEVGNHIDRVRDTEMHIAVPNSQPVIALWDDTHHLDACKEPIPVTSPRKNIPSNPKRS